MQRRGLTAGVLAAAALLALTLSARAEDVRKTNLTRASAAAPTLNLVGDAQGADTTDVAYRGGYRGGYGGYRSGYYSRGYGGGYGYRGGYGGYGYRGYSYGYRGGYGYGYRGGYGYGYRPGYYSYYPRYRYYGYYSYYPSYYGSVYYGVPYYYPGAYYYPSGGASAPVLNLDLTTAPATSYATAPDSAPAPLPPPAVAAPEEPTFPYDGGPRAPIPMPKADPTPVPDVKTPVDGHSVSLPARVVGRLSYPAYGERLQLPTAPVEDRGILVKGDPARKLTK